MIMAAKVTFISVQVFICVTLVSGSIVTREDPLQPVWDNLSQVPSKILTEMQKILNTHSTNMKEKMASKTEVFKTVLQSVKQSKANAQSEAEADESGSHLQELMSHSLTGAFETFYKSRVKTDYDAALGNDDTIASLEETEAKLMRHLDQMLRKSDFLFDFNATIEDHVYEVMHNDERRQLTIRNIDGLLNDIRERRTPNKRDVCSPVLDNLRKFIVEDLPSEQRLEELEKDLAEKYQAVVEELPSVLHRDCSDILRLKQQPPSGVYTIYPTGDPERKVNVWCDMETKRNPESKAGWTVMLRRRNTSIGLLNFNRSWDEYAEGFGTPGEGGEWWLGLNWVHELTFHQPYELMFLLRDIDVEHFRVYYSRFIVEHESRDFRLSVEGFEGTVSDAFGSFHHGQPFTTHDRDNDNCDCNCASNNQGGWWYNKCHRTVLTASFPESNDRSMKTIRWLTPGRWLVLDDVTMMMKPVEPTLQQ
ncbi:angiopoietin-related protein 7-like [Macrobrachium nipponense]|uniref:angiopoietin-related protein 7-like n=1 Tax=Macrobrachium nipponense TaxID=159736 RepID=UPI0030C7DED2